MSRFIAPRFIAPRFTASQSPVLALLVELVGNRERLSMRDMLLHVATLHVQIRGRGHELALEGHYRKAFDALQRQPRNLCHRLEAAVCLYVVALYAEQLEPKAAPAHFATAYHELFAVVDLIHERYGLAWLLDPELREQVYFFDAITAHTPLEHQRAVSLFYSRPYVLPRMVLEPDIDILARPAQAPPERPHWFPRFSALQFGVY